MRNVMVPGVAPLAVGGPLVILQPFAPGITYLC
jgi:hypothetical protein